MIDFLNGKMQVNFKKGNIQVLTNSAYETSCSYYEINKSNVDTISKLSEDRFCQVTQNLEKYNAERVTDAMKILSLSSENTKDYKTFWSIVYNLTDMEISFKSFTHQKIKTLKIKDYSFTSTSPVLYCDINNDLLSLTEYSFDINKSLLVTTVNKLNLVLDIEKASKHQINPSTPSTDSTYIKTYSTIKFFFKLKSNRGNLYYTIAQGESDFNNRRGTISTMIKADSNFIYSEAYAIKNGEYAIASFHDVNGNKKLDGGLFGIPKEPYAFSKNKKGFFGLPPKYRKVKFILQTDSTFTIKF